MTLPVPNSSIQYDSLRQAAETFGLHREAELIAQKADDQEQLFTLLVMGRRGAGKSTLINLLLGRNAADAGISQPWMNIYRKPDGAREYAEVYMRHHANAPRKLTLNQARAIVRNQSQQDDESGVEQSSIERIVWHVQSPGLPDNVSLAELPFSEDPSDFNQYLWKADGVIVVFSASEVNDENAAHTVDFLQEQRAMPVASMGVLTHMDTIPHKKWIQVLQAARTGIGKNLDVVVPSSSEADELELVLQDSNAMLYREVRNRFFASAGSLRQRNEALFEQAMRSMLATQFEVYVDRVLQNRWSYHQFRVEIQSKLESMNGELQDRIQRFVANQKHTALARAAAMDSFHFDDEEATQPVKGSSPSKVFGNDIYQHIATTTQQLFSSLEYDDLPITDLPIQSLHAGPHLAQATDDNQPAISFKLPKMPLGNVAILCGEKSVDVAKNMAQAEAKIYQQSDWGDAPPAQADEWLTATEWLPIIAQQAREDLYAWLSDTSNHIKNSLIRSAEQTFRAVHGFLPAEAPIVLMPLEETYLALTRTPAHIPTPHLPGDNLSPALFLCRMQEPEFVDIWNQQLIRRCFDYVIPRLKRQLVEDVEDARSRLAEQWEESRDSIHKRVDVVWNRYGRRLALKSAVKWSIPWVSTLMRDRLMDPVQYLARKRMNIRAPYERISLFLNEDNQQFLQPVDKPVDRPMTPDQFIVDLIQNKIRKSATTIWRDKKPITVSLPLRKMVRRRTTLALGMLFGFSLLWIMLFGTSSVSLIALSVIAIPYIGVTGALIKRLVDRMYESGSEVQAERVYLQIQGKIDERLDDLRDTIVNELEAEELWDEVLELLRDRQTTPGPCYLPYKELIKRLELMHDRTKSRHVPIALKH